MTPILAIDECANHPAVRAAQTQAIREELINRAVDLWSQLRQTADGTTQRWVGQIYREALPSDLEVSKPVKGFSWPDEYVAQLLVAQLGASDRVVLVSENTKRDIAGLRRILELRVAPVLRAERYQALGLIAFMKRGRTAWSAYAEELLQFLRAGNLPSGFNYIEK